jgi:hypothetical protein
LYVSFLHDNTVNRIATVVIESNFFMIAILCLYNDCLAWMLLVRGSHRFVSIAVSLDLLYEYAVIILNDTINRPQVMRLLIFKNWRKYLNFNGLGRFWVPIMQS